MANLDGSDVTVINPDFDGEATFVWGVAVDEDAGYLYVSNKETLNLVRSALDGSGATNWMSDIEPYALALDIYR
jgi:DNA-binding beta-propeller fold protein YncE